MRSGYEKVFRIILLFYFAVNLFFLTRFPFVHSDESWLSGLSRNILENGNFAVTETFFDLKERHPHAIKMLFHSIQILFIKFLGYSIFNVRLISLILGILTAYCFFKLCRHIFQSEKPALAASILLLLDIQFIYASHFARQEIILTFVLVYALYYLLSRIDNNKASHHVVLGIIIGLSIGIHPNAFIISLPLIFVYIYQIFIVKKLEIKNLLTYISITALFAAGFVMLSLSFDPDFFANYSRYGEEFEVFNPLSSKLAELKDFYLKLYYGVSGTYYTPAIKLQFAIFAAALVICLIGLLLNKKKTLPRNGIISIILSILAVNAGIVAIGRYNQTSIVFLFPLFYILVIYSVSIFAKTPARIAIPALALLIAANTVYNVMPYMDDNYRNYLNQISKVVGKDDRVIANLNAEFYFNNGRLYDYRNLAYLKEKGISFEQYVNKNKIRYIIYSEELDLIYSLRPRWNGIYGNPAYLSDMKRYLAEKCKPVRQFKSRTYGVRIARYINTRDWNITIYEVSE